jgi:hypothetical protein
MSYPSTAQLLGIVVRTFFGTTNSKYALSMRPWLRTLTVPIRVLAQ